MVIRNFYDVIDEKKIVHLRKSLLLKMRMKISLFFRVFNAKISLSRFVEI